MTDKQAKIVELYEKVQKIPYYCLCERDPDKLLRVKKGSCLEKNAYLGRQFEQLGIPVKYLSIKFDWNELPIPQHIIDKKDGHLGEHLALKIRVKKWITVDCTWDPGLEKAGFPLTKNWDGKTDTKLAVKPIKTKQLKTRPGKTVAHANPKFFESLNKYLDNIRKG